MSSATSTEDRSLAAAASRAEIDPGLRPWQFFLLAGMLAATAVVLIVGGQSPASIIVLSITVVVASLVALGAYRAFSPLVVPEIVTEAPTVIGHMRAALEREKTLVLRSIKELEFDYAMKKIARADFEEMSSRLRARAIGLMRQLDEGPGYRREIEREIQQRLGIPAAASDARSRVETATAPTLPVAEEAAPMTAVGVMQCECGTVNDADAKFCKTCGSKLVTV